MAANHLIPAFLDEVGSDDLNQVTFNIENERITEIQTIQKIQARPPKILLRDTWWTKILFRIISALGKGRSIIAPSDGVFGKIAWGVSEVKWSGANKEIETS